MDLISDLKDKEIEFIEALQKIISCIKEEENCDNEPISYIITKYKDIMNNVNERIPKFFEDNNFSVSNLMSIFEFVEEKCFDNLSETINQKYKEKLNPTKKSNFENLINQNNKTMKGEDIKNVLIKFVIRFLLKNESINDNENCFKIIQKNKGLYKKYSNPNNENKLAIEMGELSDLNIPVCQIIDLINNLSNNFKKSSKFTTNQKSRKRRNI